MLENTSNKKWADLAEFAYKALNMRLYPYQVEVGNAILKSILLEKGLTFSVMFARQMGKNELSAVLEAYLLVYMSEGNIIKAAPTFKPQIITSRMRLLSVLDKSELSKRVWHSYGYMIGLAPKPNQRKNQVGPRVIFLSAEPEANIVGATASILLEVDEAQDIDPDKFDRDLRPMASTNNTTTVLYGTARTEQTLLARVKANNLELEARDGIRRHFEYDWQHLAAIQPRYKTFVENEIERMGLEHTTIRTQYRLLPITGAGYLLTQEQRLLLQGTHPWQDDPQEDDGCYYIAGMDVGGEARLHEGQGTQNKTQAHDSTVITIARVTSSELNLPMLEVVKQVQWTGKPYLEQYAETIALCEHWNIRLLVIDRTGLGEVMTSLLASKLGEDRLLPFHFTRPAKSKLTYQLLSVIKSGRLRLYTSDQEHAAIYDECWQQLTLARYHQLSEHMLNMYVDPSDGHDDFLISLALCCEALRNWSTASSRSYMIPPPPLYPGESIY